VRPVVSCLVVVLLAVACSDDGSLDAREPAGPDAPAESVEAAEPTEPTEAQEGNAVSERVAYGAGLLQFGDLDVPSGDGPFPVVVFIHGGFWRNSYGLDLAEPQANDAFGRDYATWNVEYRRVGDDGGGYPGTLADIAAAIDHLSVLAGDHPLDLDRVAVVGHSAGGHLALWVGQRERLPVGAPGAGPRVVPSLVVGQAPVADLAGNLDLGGGAVVGFMGVTPDDDPTAYEVADPARLLPIVVPQLIVQGGDDRIVPPDRAEAYAALVEGERLEVTVFPGADHFDVIDANHESWAAVMSRLRQDWG
jgi:acetyl esterase/lipase